MRLTFIIALFVAAVAVLFALQNSQPVIVHFIKWSFEASLVVVLLLTFVAGVLAAFIAAIPGRIRLKRELSSCRKSARGSSGGGQG